MSDVRNYLESSSPRFREVYSGLKRAVKRAFPGAEETWEFGMPGFKFKIADVPRSQWKGTNDPNYLSFFLVERKRGITLHVWNPADYYYLDKVRGDMEAAGFKVMVGCLAWNKKADYPLGKIEEMIEDLAEKLS